MKRTVKLKVAVIETEDTLNKKDSYELLNNVFNAVYKGANLYSASVFSMNQMAYNKVFNTPGYLDMTKEEKTLLFKEVTKNYIDTVFNGEKSPQALFDR